MKKQKIKEKYYKKQFSILQAIQITRIVRRAHDSENCQHKGNCLSEKKMLEMLMDYLDKKNVLEEVERRVKDFVKHDALPEFVSIKALVKILKELK